MNVVTMPRLEKHGEGRQLFLDVKVDGIKCPSVLVCGASSGWQARDVEDVFEGKLTIPELNDRWGIGKKR